MEDAHSRQSTIQALGAPLEESRAPRPWVRYWARSVDFLTYNGVPLLLMFVVNFLMAGLLTSGVSKTQAIGSVLLFGIVALVAFFVIMLICFFGGWILIEAFFLSRFGTTPGKALLKVKVRNADGSYLSYSQACMRGLKIWYRALGLFIPVVSLITHIVAYSRLKDNQITSWDDEGSFVVTHSKIGAARIVATVAIFLGFDILYIVIQLMNIMAQRHILPPH